MADFTVVVSGWLRRPDGIVSTRPILPGNMASHLRLLWQYGQPFVALWQYGQTFVDLWQYGQAFADLWQYDQPFADMWQYGQKFTLGQTFTDLWKYGQSFAVLWPWLTLRTPKGWMRWLRFDVGSRVGG